MDNHTANSAPSNKSALLSEIIPFTLHLAQGAAMIGLRNRLDVKVPIVTQAYNNTPSAIGTLDLSILLPMFPFLSALNHGIAIAELSSGKKISPSTKWYEYSVSAGIMLWLIANLSGILDLRSLVAIAVSNVLLQFIGCRIERHAKYHQSSGLLMLIAWAVHMSMWLQIIIGFYTAIAASSSITPVPAVVYGIIWVMFTLFSGFGVWSALTTRRKREPNQRDTGGSDQAALKERIGYNTLSLVTKSVLIWMVFLGLQNAEMPLSIFFSSTSKSSQSSLELD